MLEVNKEGIILYIKFKNYDRFIRVLFVIHADFESFRLTHASWGRRRASLISIKSTNHVGSAAITSFASIHSFTSFIHKSQSSTEQRVRMKMLLRYLLKCLKENEEYRWGIRLWKGHPIPSKPGSPYSSCLRLQLVVAISVLIVRLEPANVFACHILALGKSMQHSVLSKGG